ncbi:glycosyltransferase family 2 protein [Siccirubricoccus sp. G192]|uniref:glycosyltransferase family 2 protein n=1 Tax=Siccirubricoccus sp. G192 TaxID=2849651 RepID=UPI001C2BF547|nr:glycosyltransferase family 2 protein [Siccirubricoccus sp. G192]MBV1797734.1 glycosyltransferase family 2 protein [Siccirubricoccus sp. G192]
MSDTLVAEDLDYLRRYPDVAGAVQSGRFGSAREHFEQHGQFEGRLWLERPPETAPPLIGSCDVLILSEDSFFLEGWTDDRLRSVAGFDVVDMNTGLRTASAAYRCRRMDVEQHLGAPHPTEFGLWTAGLLPSPGQAEGLAFALVYGNGAMNPLEPSRTLRLARREFFEHLLAHYGRRSLLSNVTARSFEEMDGRLGPLVTDLYGRIRATRRVTTRAGFGGGQGRPKLSLITVLYGIPDFLYLQVAQFARFADLSEIEFLFVSNSPELEEVLLRDAELAAHVFRTTIRVISLNQNCGFSHANNIGIEEAACDTIVVINPDVFPYNAAAIQRLFRYAGRGMERSIAGGKLYYADGSVMHDGMFFEPERKLTALCRAPVWTVEHFRKGFADRPGQAARPVPAVSGALMVFDRRFGRELGLFDEDFVYGHYEDADLCLRARGAGGSVILDPDLAFWHYEGKGSVKRPEHAGSGLYNRWLFSQRWAGKLEDANNV